MPTGIKPQDTMTSDPLDPLSVRRNRVISPTLGGTGNDMRRHTTGDLDPFIQGVGKVKSFKQDKNPMTF